MVIYKKLRVYLGIFLKLVFQIQKHVSLLLLLFFDKK